MVLTGGNRSSIGSPALAVPTEAPVLDRLITLSELRRRLPASVSERQLRDWVKSGRIRGAVITPSGRFLVPTSAVDQVLSPVPALEGA